jgi:hypothetical protein
MLELAKLYYEVHRCSFSCLRKTYREAEVEVEAMAKALGYTLNDLAKFHDQIRLKKILEAMEKELVEENLRGLME